MINALDIYWEKRKAVEDRLIAKTGPYEKEVLVNGHKLKFCGTAIPFITKDGRHFSFQGPMTFDDKETPVKIDDMSEIFYTIATCPYLIEELVAKIQGGAYAKESVQTV